ncbi:MAG: hypothetical protein H0T78_09645 [Longispora sp.]|nr:hypothetical protein [Longispora sp. (in: high G+C Gram-positive bacteria)]
MSSERVDDDKVLEEQITQWRAYVGRRKEITESDVDELEDHLRSAVAELIEAGLRPDEAFLVAFKRMGNLDEISREFARDNSGRLWKQLVLAGQSEVSTDATARRHLLSMVVCAVLAAVAVKVPALFGIDFDDDDASFYLRNFSLFLLVPLAAYLAWRRQVGRGTLVALALLFGLGVLAANVYPVMPESNTAILAAIHLPLALWLVVGVAYAAGEWRSHQRRMDFIRFTGEFFIYFVLIALGGGVLVGVTAATFQAIDVDASAFVASWMLPCGVAAAVVVAGWLVEAKQSVIENMAPVLTRLFTPLFTAVLIAFLVALIWSDEGIGADRDVLILFNLVLVVVLGLLLYSISAREPTARLGLFDWLQLALVLSALIIDILVMLALYGRATDAFGFTPNRVAALGENAILLANLVWSTVLLGGFLFSQSAFSRLERWQTSYLPVYAIWTWVVVLAFPPIFQFI